MATAWRSSARLPAIPAAMPSMGTGWQEIGGKLCCHIKLIGVLAGTAIMLEYLLLGWQSELVPLAACTAALVAEAVLDAYYMRLYHRLSLLVAGTAVLGNMGLCLFPGRAAETAWGCPGGLYGAAVDMALGAMVLGGLLLLLFLATGKLGFGDVCYGSALGIMLGPDRALAAFCLTFWLGLAWAGGLCLGRLVRRSKARAAVPLGPFMAAGSLISMIYGKELMAWYFQGF